ncbi:MAG: PilZ domain-containing protein [Candidatus Omnitrophota bacterium]
MEKGYGGAERRRFTRLPVSFTIFYRVNAPAVIRIKVADREIIALASDISEGGMAIVTDCEIPVVSVITVKFVMLNDKAFDSSKQSQSVTIRGEVCYNTVEKQGREYRMGVNFLDLSEENRRFICNFVSDNK